MDKKLKHRLQDIMKEKRVTNEELAGRVGAHPITISKLLNGRMKMSMDWLGRFAAALGVTTIDLMRDNPIDDDPAAPDQAPKREAMLPVYGLAAGALAGAPIMSPEPVDWIAAPPPLARVKDAYALMVTGTSMEPRYFAGDVLYVHPHRPVRAGDHVIVQIRKDHVQNETWVKRYRGEEKEQIVTEQYNPPATIRFKRAHIGALHRILTVNELFGL